MDDLTKKALMFAIKSASMHRPEKINEWFNADFDENMEYLKKSVPSYEFPTGTGFAAEEYAKMIAICGHVDEHDDRAMILDILYSGLSILKNGWKKKLEKMIYEKGPEFDAYIKTLMSCNSTSRYGDSAYFVPAEIVLLDYLAGDAHIAAHLEMAKVCSPYENQYMQDRFHMAFNMEQGFEKDKLVKKILLKMLSRITNDLFLPEYLDEFEETKDAEDLKYIDSHLSLIGCTIVNLMQILIKKPSAKNPITPTYFYSDTVRRTCRKVINPKYMQLFYDMAGRMEFVETKTARDNEEFHETDVFIKQALYAFVENWFMMLYDDEEKKLQKTPEGENKYFVEEDDPSWDWKGIPQIKNKNPSVFDIQVNKYQISKLERNTPVETMVHSCFNAVLDFYRKKGEKEGILAILQNEHMSTAGRTNTFLEHRKSEREQSLETQLKEAQTQNWILKDKISVLSSKIEKLDEKKINNAISRYEKEISKKDKALGKAKQEIRELLSQNEDLEEELQNADILKDDEKAEPCDTTAKYLFVVSHVKMANVLKKAFPNSVFGDTYSLTENGSKSLKACVCITSDVPHRDYYRYKSSCVNFGVPMIHVSSHNIEHIKRSIAIGLKYGYGCANVQALDCVKKADFSRESMFLEKQ